MITLHFDQPAEKASQVILTFLRLMKADSVRLINNYQIEAKHGSWI